MSQHDGQWREKTLFDILLMITSHCWILSSTQATKNAAETSRLLPWSEIFIPTNAIIPKQELVPAGTLHIEPRRSHSLHLFRTMLYRLAHFFAFAAFLLSGNSRIFRISSSVIFLSVSFSYLDTSSAGGAARIVKPFLVSAAMDVSMLNTQFSRSIERD